MPPPAVQVELAMQTPGVPEDVEQAPLTAAWAPARRKVVMRSWNCMIEKSCLEWVVNSGSAGRRRFICQLAFSKIHHGFFRFVGDDCRRVEVPGGNWDV